MVGTSARTPSRVIQVVSSFAFFGDAVMSKRSTLSARTTPFASTMLPRMPYVVTGRVRRCSASAVSSAARTSWMSTSRTTNTDTIANTVTTVRARRRCEPRVLMITRIPRASVSGG